MSAEHGQNEETMRPVLINEAGEEINAGSPRTKTPSPLVKSARRRKITGEVWREHTTIAPDKMMLLCLHAYKSVTPAYTPENPEGLGK